jgi:hypothetical protein
MTDWTKLAGALVKAEADMLSAKAEMRRALGPDPAASRVPSPPRRRAVMSLPINRSRSEAVITIVGQLGTANIRDVAWRLGFPREQAMVALSNLTRSGRLQRVGRGVYSLPKPVAPYQGAPS